VRRPFLDQLLGGKRSLATITVCDVDSIKYRRTSFGFDLTVEKSERKPNSRKGRP